MEKKTKFLKTPFFELNRNVIDRFFHFSKILINTDFCNIYLIIRHFFEENLREIRIFINKMCLENEIVAC